MKTKKPAKKLLPTPLREETGDQCSSCGRYTDSIMQSRNGYVCESCLESEEEQEDERPW